MIDVAPRDMLEVAGALHHQLHKIFNVPYERCPACGTDAPSDPEEEVIDAEALEEGEVGEDGDYLDEEEEEYEEEDEE